MSTPNFETQERFDLFVTDYKAPSMEDLIKDEVLDKDATESEYFDYLNSDLQIFYDDFVTNFEYELKALEKKLRKPLQYHTIELQDGHYGGIQLIVKPSEYYYADHPSELDNEDCNYNFGMCRSKAIKEFEADIKRTQKLMEQLAEQLGMTKLYCIGIFSNGEAVYQKAVA